MADFTTVQWEPKTPLSYDRFSSMMENDTYLKDLIEPAPRGVKAWKQSTSTHAVTSVVNDYQVPNSLTFSFTADADRMYRITYHCVDVLGVNGVALTSIIIKVDGTIVQQTRTTTEAGYHRPMPRCIAVVTGLSAGSRTVSVEAAKVQGESSASSILNAYSNSPMYLLVEDIGAYVGPS